MSDRPALPPSPKIVIEEIADEHYEFRAGDLVPRWLEHTEGVAKMVFAVDVTVHMDMQGGYWVVPNEPAEFPIHVEGYGPDVPAKIHGQGRGGVHVLKRPPVDVQAYLNLPR